MEKKKDGAPRRDFDKTRKNNNQKNRALRYDSKKENFPKTGE